MCWNQYVSLNTFVFGVFGLLLIAFNNAYSTYKISFFKNPYAYFFVLSIISIQFVEFLLWINMKNKEANRIISTIGILIIFIQPIASLFLLTNVTLRNKLLMIYSIPATIAIVYNIFTKDVYTKVSPCGHLSWNWVSYKNKWINIAVKLYYLFFLFFAMIHNKYYVTLISLAMYMMFIYYFYKDGSSGSIWCLSANVIMIYFLIEILVMMPFRELSAR
jgi:hypothetical protein